MFAGEPKLRTWLLACKWVSALPSVIGCLFTIFIIWLFRKYTEFSQRMIVHLSIATFIQATSFLLVDFSSKESTPCIIQGFLMHFIAWVILLWILAVMMNLILQVMCAKRMSRYEVQISIFCWFFPVLIAVMPFADDAYGPAGPWCWLKNTWRWRFGAWYIWSIASELFLLVAFILITYKLRKNEKSCVGTYDSGYNVRHRLVKEAVRTLRLYPIVYFFVIIFPAINRIQNVIHGSEGCDQYIFPLVLLHTLTDPLDGLGITLVFVLDRRTRRLLNLRSIKEAWRRKFKNKLEIQEFNLKSRLSRSDFVVATRISISSLDTTSDNEPRNDKEHHRKSKSKLQIIQEIENSFEVIIKRKKDCTRQVSFKVEEEKEVAVGCNENASVFRQEESTGVRTEAGNIGSPTQEINEPSSADNKAYMRDF